MLNYTRFIANEQCKHTQDNQDTGANSQESSSGSRRTKRQQVQRSQRTRRIRRAHVAHAAHGVPLPSEPIVIRTFNGSDALQPTALPEGQLGALLNKPYQAQLRALYEVERSGLTALDRMSARAMLDSLIPCTAPCGHVLLLPLIFHSGGRHILVPWQCDYCDKAYLLDVRTHASRPPLAGIMLHASAATVSAAYRAYDAPERHSLSGLFYRLYPDDSHYTALTSVREAVASHA